MNYLVESSLKLLLILLVSGNYLISSRYLIIQIAEKNVAFQMFYIHTHAHNITYVCICFSKFVRLLMILWTRKIIYCHGNKFILIVTLKNNLEL